jgi:hypothetical protein
MPEGKVPLAPELSVTFSQPMVAVTSQDDAAQVTPVKLSPQPNGRWRWIGTRTIVFDPEVRFPQATTYTVEVPAGTRSATGGALKATRAFTFETPAPSIVSSYPSSSMAQHLDVPMFVLFDQKIDRRAVRSAGGRRQPQAIRRRRQIADDHIQTWKIVDGVKQAEQDGHGSRFATARAAGPAIDVGIGWARRRPGPGADTRPQTFHSNYPPLRSSHCVRLERRAPRDAFRSCSKPADPDRFEDASSRSRRRPGARIVQTGNVVSVSGAAPRGRATTSWSTAAWSTVRPAARQGPTFA